MIVSCQDDNYFTLRFMFLEVGNYLLQTAANTLFVNLRYLATNTYLALGAVDLGKLLQRFNQSKGRFVENHGALFVDKRLQLGLATFLLGQKSFEGKAVTR